MLLYRICKRKYASSAFDGVGAARTGNRWNEMGVRVAYASGTLALAALELLVHVDPLDAPSDLVSVAAELPRGIKIGVARLPRDWRAMPAPASTAALGSRWVARGRTLALKVPSVIVPTEFNYMVNPGHPDFAKMVVRRPEPFEFDPRLFS